MKVGWNTTALSRGCIEVLKSVVREGAEGERPWRENLKDVREGAM